MAVGDVTAPLPAGFDLVYARFLLSHPTDIAAIVAGWCRALAPGGLLVLEEPEQIVAFDPLFARYEALVTGVVAATGADMYAGAQFETMPTPPDCERILDDAVTPRITAGAAAAMFWRNARAWGAAARTVAALAEIDDVVAALQARTDDPTLTAVQWSLRRLVLRRRA